MLIETKLGHAKNWCEQDHLFFTRYFFKTRQNIKFRVNWHHQLISDKLQEVIDGRIANLLITVSPGSSKTELAVVNFMARGLAINPRARFLHLSGSDSLASLNSSMARDIILSDEYQAFWPRKVSDDTRAKKRWNIELDGKIAGGVYATSLGGQVTGFRAGHMAGGFQGAIIIDDPIKPEDAFSKLKLETANRKLLTTVKSRKANPDTPIVVIMQRIAESDPAGFIQSGNMDGNWTFIKIPALIDDAYVSTLDTKYQEMIEESERSEDGRFSYWPYKEPVQTLTAMERGGGVDSSGNRMSRHVFSSQFQQSPVTLGGNIIKGEHFVRYRIIPKIKFRKIYADTAQKTKERNDFSVFQEWGLASDGKIYLLDMIRGKWEAPELQKRAIAFWKKCAVKDIALFGQLRKLMVEDKSSGTGLIQSLRTPESSKDEPIIRIPIEGIERNIDKFTRVNDALPYIESGCVCVPEDASFTNDFLQECESFTADNSHEHDDQIDPLVDAVKDLLSNSLLRQWEQLAPTNEKGNHEKNHRIETIKKRFT